jgi:hypothetical protein
MKVCKFPVVSGLSTTDNTQVLPKLFDGRSAMDLENKGRLPRQRHPFASGDVYQLCAAEHQTV